MLKHASHPTAVRSLRKIHGQHGMISDWTACGARSKSIVKIGELVTCEMCKTEIVRRIVYAMEHESA